MMSLSLKVNNPCHGFMMVIMTFKVASPHNLFSSNASQTTISPPAATLISAGAKGLELFIVLLIISHALLKYHHINFYFF